jgi:penicillin-binding protein 1C
MVEAARQEWFLAGTEQSQFAINKIANGVINTTAKHINREYSLEPSFQHPLSFPRRRESTSATMDSRLRGNDGILANELSGVNNARITSPTSGTIIALDPDIPPNRQRVSFSAEGQNVAWLLDGKPYAKGNAAQWLPWPGRHVVQLVDAKGVKLDEIKLEVRGAGVKSAQTGRVGSAVR